MVILGLVLAATHRTPVSRLQQFLRFDRKNGALVRVRLALPFSLPGDRAAHLPAGLHIRAVEVPLDQRWVGQRLPDGVN